jgi:S1-C subfamily serine protease
LKQAQSSTGLPASLGVTFQPLDGAITAAFGQTGALVADIVPGGPAASAGVHAGDIVMAVADTLVESPEAAQRAIVLMPVGTPSPIRVQRRAETLTLIVTAASAFDVAARAKSAGVRVEASIAAADVFPESALAGAGVARDARIVSINTRPVSSRADALRELRRSRPPALVHVQDREGERYFAVVEGPS